MVKNVKYLLVTVLISSAVAMMAQDNLSAGRMVSVAQLAAETHAAGDTIPVAPVTEKKVPLWKQKLYYGYNFDIYLHHDSQKASRENGWSIALTPGIGWKLKERVYLGVRLGGSYANLVTEEEVSTMDTSYTTKLRVHQGSWEIAPYVRYRMKTLFDGKVGIWMEAHLYTGMQFPRVSDGLIQGTDYDGLRHSVTYGFQISPVITYQFNKKSTFQIFFSILSLGYSGTTFCHRDPITGERHNRYTNDLIIFSGKLSNLIANHFTPGLYGLRFGVQKSL